jgi:hypothetical protein
VNSNGTCTKAYVDDLELVLKARNFVAGEAACKKFISAHSPAPKCYLERNGVRSTAQTDRALAYCRDVEQRAEQNRRIDATRSGRAQPPTEAPSSPEEHRPDEIAQVGDSNLLSEIESPRMRVRVVDGARLKAATSLEVVKLAVDGEFVEIGKLADYAKSRPELASDGVTACSYNVDPAQIRQGLEFSLSIQEESLVRDGIGGNPMLVWNANSTAGGVFTCLRLNASKIQLKDLRRAFRGLLEIVLAER